MGLFSSREAFFKDAYPNLHQEIHRRFGSEGFLDQAERQRESQEFEVEFLNLFREVTAEIDHIPDHIFEREATLKSGEVFLKLLIERACFSTLEEARSQLKDLEVVDPVRIVPKGMDSSDVFPEEFVDSISKDLLHITDGRYSLGQQRWSVQDKVEYFWNVVDHFTGTSTGLENVGQGITQILEVLVTLRLGSGLIVLQQPDLHLHPKAVGNLGDLIFRTIANDVFSDKRLIIETHSESLLTRLQKHKRLSLTHPDLTASDLAFKVFYCEPVPPAIIDQNLIDEISDAGLPWAFLDYVKDNISSRFDIRGFDWSRVDYVELSKEAREAMSDFAGFNFISELRVDHLGDVIDPFPISFTDLRVQDLLS